MNLLIRGINKIFNKYDQKIFDQKKNLPKIKTIYLTNKVIKALISMMLLIRGVNKKILYFRPKICDKNSSTKKIYRNYSKKNVMFTFIKYKI